MGRKKAKPKVKFPLRYPLGRIVQHACKYNRETKIDVFVTERYPDKEPVVNMSMNKNHLFFPGLDKFDALQLARMLLKFAGEEYDGTKTCDQNRPGYKGTIIY